MDKEVVRNAIGSLDGILSKAKRALQEVEYAAFGGWDNEGSYEHPIDAMVFHLEELHDYLLIVLEAAQLNDARNDLIKKWSEFEAHKSGLRHTKQFQDYETLESPALTYFERLIAALRTTVNSEITSEEAWKLALLEQILEDTAALVHRRQRPLVSEQDLKEIMTDYLSACFPDLVRKPEVSGYIKIFKPDGGINSLGAAIEFKLAHKKEQAVVAFTGVVEDTAGYKGSRHWTRFYAVLYQAKAYISKAQMQSELKRVNAAAWKAIVVNGDTAPKSRPRKEKPASTPRKSK
jgi:hypothetical protein